MSTGKRPARKKSPKTPDPAAPREEKPIPAESLQELRESSKALADLESSMQWAHRWRSGVVKMVRAELEIPEAEAAEWVFDPAKGVAFRERKSQE